MLLNLLILTLEAIEIYIITRYADGKAACMELWLALGRVLGIDVDAYADALRDGARGSD